MEDNTKLSRYRQSRFRKIIPASFLILTPLAAVQVARSASDNAQPIVAELAQPLSNVGRVGGLGGLGLPVAPLSGGEVHGSIYALIRGEPEGGLAPLLPDIGVYLENANTQTKSPVVTTDINGTFRIPSQPEAIYHLCWQATGFAAGCKDDNITLRAGNIYLSPIGILAEPGILHGMVTLADGSPCRLFAGFLKADTIAKVTATFGGGSSRTARINSTNEYVLAGLPSGAINTAVHCDDLETSAMVTLSGGAVTRNYTLSNTLPKVSAFYAQANGITVSAAATGTAVRATVEAQPGTAGFPLHYRWYVEPPSAGFVSPDQNTADMTISGPGLTEIFVLVHDDHGGNAIRRLALSARPDQILFSGHVRGDTVASLAGATVTINGIQTKTGAAGNFVLALPKEEARYVATIEKVGYQLMSKTFFTPVQGGNYELFHAQQMPVSPGEPVQYIEPSRDGQDTKGTEVVIAADSLAQGRDGTGALASQPLVMHAASYNLRNASNPIPGDFTGLDKANKPSRLSTFGAVDVSITDAAGNPYNLANGKTALVRLPIEPAMLATAPATIAVWHFDPVAGVWNEDGEATRSGNFYETKVTHFSAINMDLAFNDGACTRIVVDQSIMPTPFKIRMTPQNGSTVRPDHQDQIVDGPLSVVVRQPPNIDVVYDMVDSNDNVIPAATQTVHTGNSSATGQQWPVPNSASPYADCTSEVDYNEQTVKALFPTLSNDFLTYQTPTTPKNLISGSDADAFTTAYYAKIDPTGTKTKTGDTNDFANWKTANGFGRSGETNTKYGNNYDLGFGRDMHMQTGGETGSCPSCIAYYVTNYNTVEDAVNNGTPIATVAMEYSPQNGASGTPYTKFYVFGANGAISLSANLDQNGPKNVPSLCAICHNGNVNSMGADGSIPFARFIPFDLDSFAYTANASFPQYQRPGNEADFKALNKQILQTNVSQPVLALTTQWYGNVGDKTLPNNFNGAIVPSGWTSPTNESPLYNSVAKPFCRSCHTTRDPADTGQDISWDTYDSLNQDGFFVRILACVPSSHSHAVMPQAKRTFARFWLSTTPNGPIALGSSGIQGFTAPNNSCPN